MMIALESSPETLFVHRWAFPKRDISTFLVDSNVKSPMRVTQPVNGISRSASGRMDLRSFMTLS
jgi:hypothetical protein